MCCNFVFAKPPLSLYAFCPKLAGRYLKSRKNKSGDRERRKSNSRASISSNGGAGNDSGNKKKYEGGQHTTSDNDSRHRCGNNDENRGGANDISSSTGDSIINNLPSTLSKNYCGHFLDTSLKCNFGGSCKKNMYFSRRVFRHRISAP